MHVTLVASAFRHPERSDFPGERRYSTELALKLARSGVDVRVVVPAANGDGDDSAANIEVVRLKCLKDSIGRAAYLGQVNVMSFASQLIRTGQLVTETDVIHSTVPLLTVDTIRQRCPVVAFNHHVERVRGITDLLTVPFGNSYGSYMYHRADAVVTPSRATATKLVRDLGVDPRKVTVIHHGIDTETFFPNEKATRTLQNQKEKTILFVGSINARKNVTLLMRAFKSLVGSVPGAQLVLVGAGPLDREIDRLARSPLLRGKVLRLARLSDEELRDLYSEAAVFVWPSLDEGFGFAVVEAMACGTPVVALDTIINREIIGDAGILVRDPSPRPMADAILSLLEDSQLANTLAERGLKRVLERYAWTVASAKYVELFQGLLNSRVAS